MYYDREGNPLPGGHLGMSVLNPTYIVYLPRFDDMSNPNPLTTALTIALTNTTTTTTTTICNQPRPGEDRNNPNELGRDSDD